MRKRFFGLELSHWRRKDEPTPYYYTRLYRDPDGKAEDIFEAQTSIGGKHRWFGFSFGTDDCDGRIDLSIGVGFASIYTHFGRYKARKNREISLRYYPKSEGVGEDFGYFSWRLWTDPDSWSSSTPRWRDGMFRIAEFIFGPHGCKKEQTGDVQTVEIKMPEGSYTAKCTPERATWYWPRFKKSIVQHYIEVEVDGGIPVPGKGESGWDCGDDAIIATGFCTDSVQKAAQLFAARVMETREKYASRSWTPSAA